MILYGFKIIYLDLVGGASLSSTGHAIGRQFASYDRVSDPTAIEAGV